MYAEQCVSSLHKCWWLWELRIRGSDSLKLYYRQTQAKLRQCFVLSLQRTQIQQNTGKNNPVELIATKDMRSLFTDNPIFPNERKVILQHFCCLGGWGYCDILSLNLIYWARQTNRILHDCSAIQKLMRKESKASVLMLLRIRRRGCTTGEGFLPVAFLQIHKIC